MPELKTYKVLFGAVRADGVLHTDTVDLSEKDARRLIAIGTIEPLEEQPSNNGETELTDEQKRDSVVEAIGALDADNEDNFTKSGLPNANVLSDIVGFDVSADLRDDALKSVKARIDRRETGE